MVNMQNQTKEQIKNWFIGGTTLAFIIQCILILRFGTGRAVNVVHLDMAIKIGYVLLLTFPIIFAYVGYRRVKE